MLNLHNRRDTVGALPLLPQPARQIRLPHGIHQEPRQLNVAELFRFYMDGQDFRLCGHPTGRICTTDIRLSLIVDAKTKNLI